jgi:haloalkane dehalogenase
MDILRTPDDRFADLPGYPFAPNYVDVNDDDATLRVHYVDEGPKDAAPVLLLHGEPSWSFLYRKMIPVITDAGYRAVAPDLVGFGRSDKPAERTDYTYARHVAWMHSVVEALDLHGATLFGQDWGGLVGLRVAAEDPDRFARIVVGNTGLPTGDRKPSDAFLTWQKVSQETPEFPVGRFVAGGCRTKLTPEIITAYDAPFPDETYKEGARQFPLLVPTSPDDPAADANRRAWEVFGAWDKPFLTAFSDSDPITGGGERPFQKLIPGAQGREHVTIKGAGHFLQEDAGEELAGVIVSFIRSTSD